MQDTKFFKMMGVLQLLIAFINFYVAFGAMSTLGMLNIAVGVICTMAGVFCTVLAAKLFGALD
jgi:hypothetical protein